MSPSPTSPFVSIDDNPLTARARVIADSVSPEGVRITSVEEIFWRPVLAERNTHKNQYGNSASSRAMPFEKQLRRFDSEPANPTSWPAEQPGMQGGAELTGLDLVDAQDLWDDIKASISDKMWAYLDAHPDKSTRLHKSVLNRVIEFGQWHTRITTATAWQNFFDQRCDADAQPEIRDVALLIRDAMEASTPQPLAEGMLHAPYFDFDTDSYDLGLWMVRHDLDVDDLHLFRQYVGRVSSARCARTSYETQAGVRDIAEDVTLYDRLITERLAAGKPIHWSPLEHVATPCEQNRQAPCDAIYVERHHPTLSLPSLVIPVEHLPRVGSLVGWLNLRSIVEAENGVVTYK